MSIQLVATETRESSGPKVASIRVSQMLQLRSIVKNIPVVRDAVRGCHSRLMEIVCEVTVYHVQFLLSSLKEDYRCFQTNGSKEFQSSYLTV